MGKRVTTGSSIIESHHQYYHHHNHSQQQQQNIAALNTLSRKGRKRKCNIGDDDGDMPLSGASSKKALRVNTTNSSWRHIANTDSDNLHENDNGSSEDEKSVPHTAATSSYCNVINNNGSITMGKHGNNDSIKLNTSFDDYSKGPNQNGTLIESPKPVYTLRPSIVNGTILCDLKQQSWRLGKPIGKGNFGEIFLASDDITTPVTNKNAKFVVKIEPHSNGPLFVEIHCLMNTAKKNFEYQKQEAELRDVVNTKNSQSDIHDLPYGPPSGIPKYIASGSHRFGNGRYRFLVLPRFDRDLHSLIKNCCVHQKAVLTLAIQVIHVLEKLHNSGYCHNDVKAQNLMISKCKYVKLIKRESSQQRKQRQESLAISKKLSVTKELKSEKSVTTMPTNTTIGTSVHVFKHEKYEEKQQTTDSGNSSEQDMRDDHNDDDGDTNFVLRRRMYNNISSTEDDDNDEDEDFDDGATTTNSSSIDVCHHHRTVLNRKPLLRPTIPVSHQQQQQQQRRRVAKGHVIQKIEFSGSNPVRSCRRDRRRNSIYEEMVKSHYLRPAKRISYLEFFNEDVSNAYGDGVDGSSGDLGNNNRNLHSTNLADGDDRDDNNIVDDDSDEFMPPNKQRSTATKNTRYKSQQRSHHTRCKRLTRRQETLLANNVKNINNNNNIINKAEPLTATIATDRKSITEYGQQHSYEDSDGHSVYVQHEEEHIFLIDYGLASKYTDNGVHRPFIMDQRRAHDGTLEFTSRDAHMGAHSRRSDLECLGYNLLFWSQGYLPWKDAATNQQPEKVHRAKEYLMLNVREILCEIYGQHIPKYLGEFLHLVGQLSYNERPDYERYRHLFEYEYAQLGYTLNDMHLNMDEIARTCVRVRKSDIENKTDFFKVTSKSDIVGGVQCCALNIIHNMSVDSTPIQERTLSNRVSPKNLRSKSSKKTPGTKSFSWAEILLQDPDQIARERAEKEFEREEMLSNVQQLQESHQQQQQQLVRKYQGKPTYAIKEILRHLKQSNKTLIEETVVDKNNRQQQQEKWQPYSVSTNTWSSANATNIATSFREISKAHKKDNLAEQVVKGSHRLNDVSNNQSSNRNNGNLHFTKSIQLKKKLSKSATTITPLNASTPVQVPTSSKRNKKIRSPNRRTITKKAASTIDMNRKTKIQRNGHQLRVSTTTTTVSPKRTCRTRRYLIRPVNIMRHYNDDEESISNDFMHHYNG